MRGGPSQRALAARLMPRISQDECNMFRASYMGAPVQPDGSFQLANMTPPEGEDAKWLYRMCKRDCSHLALARACGIQQVEETVLDISTRNFTKDGKPTASYRTVSIHVKSDGSHHMLICRRREDMSSTETGSLARLVFDESDQVLKSRIPEVGNAIKLCDGPVLSLDAELSHPEDRRMLVAAGAPYAIRLDLDHSFERVVSLSDSDPDAFESPSVGHIFDRYRPRRDTSRVNHLVVADLRERPGTPGRFVHEVLLEVPVNDGHAYFLTWPALPPAERHRALHVVVPLAKRAAEMTLKGPAAQLRMHEFHHPHDENYYKSLHIVASGIGV